MKHSKRKNRFSAIAFLMILGLWIYPVPVFSHEESHGHENKSMSAHMKAMMEVKEKIPQEYRVMDRTPVTPTSESLARGKEIYLKNCAVCHGREGDGSGPAAAGMKTKPANFLDLGHSAVYGPGEKYWIVGNGTGETGMPPFPNLGAADKWHVVNYVFSFQMDGNKPKK